MSSLDAALAEEVERRAAAVRSGPDDARTWRELGMLYQAHNLFELARQCYEHSHELSPEDARTRFYLAQVERRLGRLTDAVESLREATRLDARYAPAHWRLALWLLEDGNTQAARQAADRAFELDPADRGARMTLARLHLQDGEAAQAALLLEGYLDERPGDRYAHFLLGDAYRRLGRTTDAQRHLTQGSEPELGDPWSDEVATARAGFGVELAAGVELLGPQPLRATERLEALRAIRPDNATVLINLGIAYRRSQRLGDSRDVLREAVEREPGRGLAHLHLAVTTMEMARRDRDTALLAQALEHARKTIELQPTSAKGHAVEGEVLAVGGRSTEAVASYRRAASLAPADPAFHRRLGELLCQLQRWREAVPVRRRRPGP